MVDIDNHWRRHGFATAHRLQPLQLVKGPLAHTVQRDLMARQKLILAVHQEPMKRPLNFL
jgi:hypothetical protein